MDALTPLPLSCLLAYKYGWSRIPAMSFYPTNLQKNVLEVYPYPDRTQRGRKADWTAISLAELEHKSIYLSRLCVLLLKVSS